MQRKMVNFVVTGLALDEHNRNPVVILQNAEGREVLPLTIGPFEASAIIMEIEGVHPPRPLTHDLFSEFFRRHRFQMIAVEIYGRENEDYYSRIRYRSKGGDHSMEVRPSDGIALALRQNAPILVAAEIAAAALPAGAANDDVEREYIFLESRIPEIQLT